MPVSEAAFEVVKRDVSDLRQAQAVEAERNKNVDARLTKVETILSRLTWIVITAAVGSIVAWIINGGVAIGG